MGDDLTITIREKDQYETFSAYLEYIKQSVAQQNNNIIMKVMEKDSEIAELKSKVTALEAESANVEKSESQINMVATLNDALSQIKEHDSKTDGLIAKVDEFIGRQNLIEEDIKRLEEKLSGLSNGSVGYDVAKQEELEDIMKDIYAVVIDLKGKTIAPLVSDENSNDNEIKGEFNQENNQIEPTVNSDNNQELNQATDENSMNAVPFANYQETIAPTVGTIDSIVPQENVEEQTVSNGENNIIEETSNNQEIVNPISAIEGNTEDAQKVVGSEEAPQEMIEKAKQSTELTASGIKVTRSFLKKSKGPKSAIVKTFPLNRVELPNEFKEYFKSAFVQNGMEVNIAKTR